MARTQRDVKGKGSIVQFEKDKPRSKCRKWQLRVSTGRDPRSGKYITKTKTVHGSYTEATKALRSFIEAIEEDKLQGHSGYTFEQYCNRYLERREAKKEVAPTTLRRHGCQFKAACHHIGGLKLEEVTPSVLDDMYVAMMQGETLSGKKSGGSYVNQIHDNITLVFEAAKNEGLLVSNPCDGANPPKMDTKAKKAIEPTKVHELVEELNPSDPHECAYLLAITLGLRRGEICGLSWRDIDFERNIVDVTHSYDNLGNLKETKTRAGMRLLPLSETTKQALLAMKQTQKEQFEKTNRFRKPSEGYLEQTEDTPVITGHCGERVSPPAMSRWWTNDREAFGLDGFTLHELRHTYLTLLAMGGVHPKVMQELAGHHSSQITMDIYTHVNMDVKREAVETVSKLF